MFLLKFILTNICGHFECFFGKNYLYCTWLGTSRLYSESETVSLLATLLLASELNDAKREIWRGTFAAIIYDRFRIPAVHDFGPPDWTTFDNTTFQGQPVPGIDFFMVHDCLKKVVGVAREISIKTGKFFGHNYN
jgi:hypothetical protein